MPRTFSCPSCGTAIVADDGRCGTCGYATPSSAHAPGDTGEFIALTADVTETLSPRFQNVRLLGQGGMGLVFTARDPGLKRDVAVKVLHPDAAAQPNAHMRFVREAQAAAAVNHPNVVTVYQVGELHATGAPYFVMQFVDGQTLEQAFPHGAPVPEPTARCGRGHRRCV